VPDSRRRQVVLAARRLLDAGGEDAISMRAIAAEVGIRAPSLYKHFPDKAAIETAIIADGLTELGEALQAGGPDLAGMAAAYRDFALSHPHLYTLMTQRPLDRDRLPEGLEGEVARPLLEALGDEHRARAAWASAHGLAILELNGRFPPDADLGAAWAAVVAAFPASASSAHAANAGEPLPPNADRTSKVSFSVPSRQ